MSKHMIGKTSAISCALLLVLCITSNAQNRQRSEQNSSGAQPIDWGRALDLSKENTQTKPERLSLQKELELGRQIREQNQRSQPDYPGRPDNSRSGGSRAAVSGPQIEMKGVFERNDRPERWYGPDGSSSGRSEETQRYSRPNQSAPRYAQPNQFVHPYPGRNSRGYGYRGHTVSRAEIFLYSQNTHLVPVVDYYQRVAVRETVRRFGGSREDDPSDAFRHAYASALLSRALGPYQARVITDAHEMRSDISYAGRQMDLHNNRIGIQIGQMPLWRGVDSERQLADMIERALRNNRLMVLRP